MAARSVRCLVSNQTPFTMNHVSDSHRFGGQFTDPWYPPATIASGHVAEWRSESDAFLAGAIGTARYSISVADNSEAGPHKEFIDIDWHNPYVGFNDANGSATNDFSGTPSTDLKVTHFIQSGSIPNAAKVGDVDFEAWLDTLLFPPYILANAVSYNDTNAFYGIQYQPAPAPPPPQFQDEEDAVDLTTLPRKLNNEGNPAQWAGEWQGDGIYVTLFDLSGGRMSVSVTDRTANPMLQFAGEFTLGELSWVGQHMMNAAISQDLGTHSHLSKVFRSAAASALHGVKDPSKVFNKAALTLAKKTSVRLNPAMVSKAATSTSIFKFSSLSTAYLVYGVSLTLYDVFAGNSKQGQLLNYKRCDSVGKTLADALLLSIPIIH